MYVLYSSVRRLQTIRMTVAGIKGSNKMLDSVRGSHVVLLIGLACVVQTTGLTCIPSDPKCHYEDQTLTCKDLRNVPKLWWKDDFCPISQLILSKGQISTISKISLPSDLESISLNQHPLTHISDDAFDLSATSLYVISISRAEFRTLPRALSTLSILGELNIENMPIYDWDNATLQQLSRSVLHLVLKNVSLTSWPPWISEFRLLFSLDLSYNSLKFIPDDAFNSFAHTLIDLCLTGTALMRVPQAISILSNLEALFLSENKFTDVTWIRRITKSSFSRTLKGIHMTSAGISRVPNLSSFTSLDLVDFSFNKLSSIAPGRLPPSLLALILSDNDFSYVPRVIASLSRLFYLNLHNNKINRIISKVLPPSLTTLDLSNNEFTAIRKDFFKKLILLDELYLSNNPITKIAKSAFNNLVSLKRLTLDQTHLTEIPLAFKSLDPLVEISMSTAQPLSCPCPANRALLRWFRTLRNPNLGPVQCNTGLRINVYLAGQCVRL